MCCLLLIILLGKIMSISYCLLHEFTVYNILIVMIIYEADVFLKEIYVLVTFLSNLS